MEFEGVRRSSQEVSGKEPEALLGHVHLGELVRQRVHTRRLVRRALTKSGSIDVLRLRLRTTVVRSRARLGSDLLLSELTISSEAGGKELRLLSTWGGNSAVSGPRWCNSVRPVVRLRLSGCILTTFGVVLRLVRGRRCARCAVHGLRIGERGLPLRPTRRSL